MRFKTKHYIRVKQSNSTLVSSKAVLNLFRAQVCKDIKTKQPSNHLKNRASNFSTLLDFC